MADRSVYSTYPDTLTTSNDGQGITIETAFYVVGVSGWSVKGVKLWVPTGSAMIGQSVTLKAWVPGVESAGLAGTAQGTGTFTAVAGWNQVTFTPVAVTAGVKFGVSYTTSGPYLVGTNPTLETRAADGSALYESEQNSGGSFVPQYRGAYRYASGSGAKFELRSGLDVIMDDGTTSSTTGTIAGSTPKITGTINGASLTTGGVTAALPKVTATISGTVDTTVTGSITAAVPKVTGSTPGAVVTAGSVTGSTPKISAAINGAVTVTGSAAGQLPKVTGSVSSGLSIAQENALTSGVQAPAFWFNYGADEIPGFARSSYYTPGQTARFSVDYASSFTVQVWRLGWYGSDGARKVAEFAGTTATQPTPVTIANSNGAVTCAAWSENVTWSIPSDATPGWYWLFMRNSGGTQFGGILFCVSDINAKKPILVVASEATWGAAYNGYGGNNVYGASTGIGSISGRAYCSTYDKPVISRDNVPQTHFFNGELATLRFLERLGFEVGYTTCEQINNDPTIMDGRSLVIFSGHNEYISQRIRDKTAAVIAAGTNIINLSGNDFFWRVAYGDESGFPTGNTNTSVGRVMWCRKDTMTGPTGSGHTAGTPFSTQSDWTGTWQDTRYTNRQPSTDLLGDRFIANGIRADAVKVPFSMKGLPIWRDVSPVQALTSGQEYAFGTGTAGMEWDMPDGSLPSVSLSASVVDLTGNSSDANGENYNLNGTYTHAFQMVRNGTAYIFNGNTTQWGWALDDLHLRGSSIAATAALQATLNVLYDLGAVGVSGLITGASLVVPTPVSNVGTAYGLASTTTGSISGTLPAVTGSVAGNSITVGTFAASLPVVTGSVSGASLTVGSIAGAAIPKITGSVSGTAITVGVISAATPILTGSVTGQSLTTGALAGTLPAVTGAIFDIITGSISGSTPKLTGSVSGTLIVTGAISGSLPSVTGSVSGDGLVTGSLAAALPKITGSVAGTVVTVGTVGGSLPAIQGSIIGAIAGTVDAALPRISGSLSGVVVVTVTGSIAGTLPRVVGAANAARIDFTITAGTPILGPGIIVGSSVW